jgi:hypothetical protein
MKEFILFKNPEEFPVRPQLKKFGAGAGEARFHFHEIKEIGRASCRERVCYSV